MLTDRDAAIEQGEDRHGRVIPADIAGDALQHGFSAALPDEPIVCEQHARPAGAAGVVLPAVETKGLLPSDRLRLVVVRRAHRVDPATMVRV
ncbi:MAG: hypothetical protein Kow0022_01510 [Phycisphaerales bacterium]